MLHKVAVTKDVHVKSECPRSTFLRFQHDGSLKPVLWLLCIDECGRKLWTDVHHVHKDNVHPAQP